MWAKLLSITASLIQISSLLVENERKIEDLQTQVTELRGDLKELAQKFDHFSEIERANHRNNLLELENRILQMERRLPPANETKAE